MDFNATTDAITLDHVGQNVTVVNPRNGEFVTGELTEVNRNVLSNDTRMRVELLVENNGHYSYTAVYTFPDLPAQVPGEDTPFEEEEEEIIDVLSVAVFVSHLAVGHLGKVVEFGDGEDIIIGDLRELRATSEFIQLEVTGADGRVRGFRFDHGDIVSIYL